MKFFIGTAREFMTANKIDDYAIANGVLRFLTEKGLARKVDKRSNGGKGKPSDVYCLASSVTLTVPGNADAEPAKPVEIITADDKLTAAEDFSSFFDVPEVVAAPVETPTTPEVVAPLVATDDNGSFFDPPAATETAAA